jgi:dethiobiotin synthetase
MTVPTGNYPPRGLFITGSGTEVGKTYVACLLAKKLSEKGFKVGVYKPAASGAVTDARGWISQDAVDLWEAAGRVGSLQDVCPQVFRAPLAPPLAAAEEGRIVDEGLLLQGLESWRGRCEFMLVEGAGGLMSPISESLYNADLAHAFGYPLVVVVPNRLGVINGALQTLLTAEHYRGGTRVAGIVLCDATADGSDMSRRSNHRELEKRCGVPILNHVQHGVTEWATGIDWIVKNA